jgi:hypothetical protein
LPANPAALAPLSASRFFIRVAPPWVHAATKAVRRELRNAYFNFVAAYRDAAAKLRAGKRDTPFPMGCFPPALPFVGG